MFVFDQAARATKSTIKQVVYRFRMPTLTNAIKLIPSIYVSGTFWDCTNTMLSRCALQTVLVACVNQLTMDSRQMVMVCGLLSAWDVAPGLMGSPLHTDC